MRRVVLVSLLAAWSCSKPDGSCPTGTTLVGESCRASCEHTSECLLGEVCVGKICVAGTLKDAGVEMDAGTQPDAGEPDAGSSPDASVDCHGLDENSCANTKDCKPGKCPSACNGPQVFAGCFFPNEAFTCPQPTCDCATLGLDGCQRNANLCESLFCNACDGSAHFNQCYNRSGAPPICPPQTCACQQITTAAICETLPGCAAIMNPPMMPGCPCDVSHPACCLSFNSCVPAPVDCAQTHATCDRLPPECTPNFVPAIANECYLGCVNQRKCQM
ncbi:MAG: hypothetical protein U1E65_09035 [Myxococcota bacterium]